MALIPPIEDAALCMNIPFSLIASNREDMVESCRSRCSAWVSEAASGTQCWVKDPQRLVFQHTFRDRQPSAEIGPSNGHISGRKYIPRYTRPSYGDSTTHWSSHG